MLIEIACVLNVVVVTFAGFVKTALIRLNYYTNIMINGACHDKPSSSRTA